MISQEPLELEQIWRQFWNPCIWFPIHVQYILRWYFEVLRVFQALKDIISLYGHDISGTVRARANLKTALESSYMISYSWSIHILALGCILREISASEENDHIWSIARKWATAELSSKKKKVCIWRDDSGYIKFLKIRPVVSEI